jgi:hypothetical protein
VSYQYPIGKPGVAWSQVEKSEWLSRQKVKRSYQQEVLEKLDSSSALYEIEQYGALPYDPERYPLFAAKSRNWNDNLPVVLVTGGVHGYETSGVQGALSFLNKKISNYLSNFNFVIAPCVSPWGYETINRWNPGAVDPNRSFKQASPAPEAELLMAYIHSLGSNVFVHFDLHETTDTDNTEFRPALAARDAIHQDVWDIPDGFYTVDDSSRAQFDFQQAVINSVKQVTHIAPPDKDNKIIGADVTQPGVIHYDKRKLFLCGGFTEAKYVTTTEVYPDSPSATAEQCIDAQVAAIIGGLDYLLTL